MLGDTTAEVSFNEDCERRLGAFCGKLATSKAEFLLGSVTSLGTLLQPLLDGLCTGGKLEAECIRGRVPDAPDRSLRGGNGGGLVSRGGRRGASVACFVQGDVSPIDDSLLRLGGKGGGGNEGGFGNGGGNDDGRLLLMKDGLEG